MIYIDVNAYLTPTQSHCKYFTFICLFLILLQTSRHSYKYIMLDANNTYLRSDDSNTIQSQTGS